MPRLYGWASTSERVYGAVDKGKKGKVSLIASVSLQGLDTKQCFNFEGVVDGSAFLTYLEHVLLPGLKPGSVIIMDNFRVHYIKQVRQLIEHHGCYLVYLPTYSPDLNPIEFLFAKVKAYLRKLRAQTIPALKQAFAQALQLITPQDVKACFEHCGYS